MLGWIHSRNKMCYVDGHKQQDVVVRYRMCLYQLSFLRFQSTITIVCEKVMLEISVQLMPLPSSIKRRIPYVFNANDGTIYLWKKADSGWL